MTNHRTCPFTSTPPSRICIVCVRDAVTAKLAAVHTKANAAAAYGLPLAAGYAFNQHVQMFFFCIAEGGGDAYSTCAKKMKPRPRLKGEK